MEQYELTHEKFLLDPVHLVLTDRPNNAQSNREKCNYQQDVVLLENMADVDAVV